MPFLPRRLRLPLCALGLLILLCMLIGGRWSWRLHEVNPLTESRQLESSLVLGSAKQMNKSLHKRIPCLIHQSWKTMQLPSDRARRWRSTWLRCMPTCKHILWTDQDNERLIRNHYQWLLSVYNSLSSGVQKSDLARYVYMLHYGGIYSDIDTICQRDFHHLLTPWSLVFGGMEGSWMRSVNGTYVQNSFMASEAGHPFWLGLLHRIALRHRKRLPGGAEESTGPLILMEELQRYLESGLKDVKIFPAEFFNPFSWISNRKNECKTHGAMSNEEEKTCVSTFPNAFVVQLHCKSWGGGSA